MVALAMTLLAAREALGQANWYISGSASGTTNAATFWPASPFGMRLISADVTSDLSSSVLTWRIGAASANVVIPALSTATNVTCWVSTAASNDTVLTQNATNGITQLVVYGNTKTTNVSSVEMAETFGTNLAIGDSLYKRSVTLHLTAFAASNSTTIYIASTNMVATNNLLVVLQPNGLWSTTISTVSSNTNGVCSITLASATTADWFAPILYTATNTWNMLLPKPATDRTFDVTNSTGLIVGDQVVIVPASGGTFGKIVGSITTNKTISALSFKSAIGIPLAAGDQVFGTTSQTTPVGAATLRLYGPAILWAPPSRPAALSVNGTSACAVNGAIGASP